MLDEEDFRTALRRPYFQGPDVVEAGQHRLKHAAEVTQLVRIRSYEGLEDLRVVRLHIVERTGRFPREVRHYCDWLGARTRSREPHRQPRAQ